MKREGAMMRKAILAAIGAAGFLSIAIGAAHAETVRIAEHRQARIDALKTVVPDIEKKLGVTIEVVEYPAPEKDYLTKLLTELGAGNAPATFTAPRAPGAAHKGTARVPPP